LLVSELTGFVRKQAMKTAGREKPKPLRRHMQRPSTWQEWSAQILLNYVAAKVENVQPQEKFVS
jgi:hypothetical protein